MAKPKSPKEFGMFGATFDGSGGYTQADGSAVQLTLPLYLVPRSKEKMYDIVYIDYAAQVSILKIFFVIVESPLVPE